ncbi:MAG: GNAT family N-acetyltransferase [Chryseolinea sp.]
MNIRKAKVEDLKIIAECHQKAFPKSLSSAMGVTYLMKMLEWYLRDERAFLFYIEENNKYVGYCGGLKHDGKTQFGSASSMIQHSFNAAVKAMLMHPWLFVHPEFVSKYKLTLKNIWKRLKGSSKTSAPKAPPLKTPIEPHAGLIVIGVDPAYQGKGFGSKLLQEFETVSKEMGFHKLMLTVKSENAQAIKSYQRNGWYIVSDDGKSVAMDKDIH